MNILKAKRIRHFLRLSYPIRIVAQESGFRGDYPDLPGCVVTHCEIFELYSELELLRRQWLTERVLEDAPIPLPNTYLQERDPSRSASPTTEEITNPCGPDGV